jgi:hypothetical protein
MKMVVEITYRKTVDGEAKTYIGTVVKHGGNVKGDNHVTIQLVEGGYKTFKRSGIVSERMLEMA